MLTLPDTVVLNRVDDEAMVLDTKSGRYYGLNEVATQMLEGLLAGRSQADVVAGIAARYEADAARIATDLDRLLADLRERGLVDE